MNEANEERKKIYAETRSDLLKRQLSNAENFDKAVLSLSTGGLGLSLGFVKSIVPIKQAEMSFLLYLSWIAFIIAIISTLISYLTSQAGINKQLLFAKEYYLNNKDEYLSKTNYPAKLTNTLGYVSALFFICAILLTVTFISINFEGDKAMTGSKKTAQAPLKEGASVPGMQRVVGANTVDRGAPIPNMQPAPQPPNQSQTGSGGQSSSDSQGQSGANSGSGSRGTNE